MVAFLEEFSRRTDGHFPTLMADIRVDADGMTHDPAAWEDWLECVRRVTGSSQHGSAGPAAEPS